MNLLNLPQMFRETTAALILHQFDLNEADPANRNHGDHMVEIFQTATEAATAKMDARLDEAMGYAAELLRRLPQNGSAQVYARGLAQLAGQFRQRDLGLDDLAPYVQRTVEKQVRGTEAPGPEPARSADVLKALLNGLAGWEKAETEALTPSSGQAGQSSPLQDTKSTLDMGYLFGVGMSYLQARQRGGDRFDILVDTVVSASPLARLPHRYLSGKIALRALLEAMARQ